MAELGFWAESLQQGCLIDIQPLWYSLLFPAVARYFPRHLPQQHHEADNGGLILQNPYQRHLPGLQQAGEALWVEGAESSKKICDFLDCECLM